MKICENGNSFKFVNLKLTKNTTLDFILEGIKKKMKWDSSLKIRIFTQKGIELHENDVKYIKDKDTLYVSRGKALLVAVLARRGGL